MLTRFAYSHCAALAAFLILLAGCNKSATSALPPAPIAENPGQMSPEILERGPTPVQWAIFTHPTNSTHYAFPVADHSNNVWFESDNRVIRINYSGTNLGTFATITTGTLANLQLGGDGNVWYGFTSQSGGANPNTFLFAVNSGGTLVKEYKIPGTSFDPNFPSALLPLNTIAAGIGTDIWAGGGGTQGDGGFVLVHNNALQQFHCDASPVYSTVSPDGKVWFTGSFHGEGQIDVLDPKTGSCMNAVFEEVQQRNPIVTGSDGNVWTIDTGSNGSVLVRVNTKTFARTNFGVGLHILMTDLVSGPDGDLWISFHTASATGLIRASTSGTVLNRFTCPAQFCANAPANFISQLANAPDGNVYFAYNGVDNHAGIGAYVRLSMTIAPSSVTFTHVGQTQLIKIAEANYAGTWTVATTTPSVVKVVSRPAPNEALIQAVGPGSGRVIVRDTRNNYYGVSVSVL